MRVSAIHDTVYSSFRCYSIHSSSIVCIACVQVSFLAAQSRVDSLAASLNMWRWPWGIFKGQLLVAEEAPMAEEFKEAELIMWAPLKSSALQKKSSTWQLVN